MNKLQVQALLTYASAFDNRLVTDIQVAAWTEALATDMRLDVAKEAIRQFFASPEYVKKRPYLMPADLNAFWRRWKRDHNPSEGDIMHEMRALGIEGDASWEYRRNRLSGRTIDESAQAAKRFRGLDSARGLSRLGEILPSSACRTQQ